MMESHDGNIIIYNFISDSENCVSRIQDDSGSLKIVGAEITATLLSAFKEGKVSSNSEKI